MQQNVGGRHHAAKVAKAAKVARKTAEFLGRRFSSGLLKLRKFGRLPVYDGTPPLFIFRPSSCQNRARKVVMRREKALHNTYRSALLPTHAERSRLGGERMLPKDHWLALLGSTAMALGLLTTHPTFPKVPVMSPVDWQDVREDLGDYIAAIGWESATAYALTSETVNDQPPDWWR
jgi:hypothetical protein